MVKKNRYFDLTERENAIEKGKQLNKTLKESWSHKMTEGTFVKGDGFSTGKHLHNIKKPFKEEEELDAPVDDAVPPTDDVPAPVSVDEPEGATAKENEASLATKEFIDSLQLPTEANFVELPKAVAPVEDVVTPEEPTVASEVAPEGEEVVAEQEEVTPEESTVDGEVAPEGGEVVAPEGDVTPESAMESSGVFMGEINDPQHGAFKIVVFPVSLYNSIADVAAAVDPVSNEVAGDEVVDDLGAEESPLNPEEPAPVEEPVVEPVEDEELAEEVQPEEKEEEEEEDEQTLKESKQYPTGQGKKDWKNFFINRYKK